MKEGQCLKCGATVQASQPRCPGCKKWFPLVPEKNSVVGGVAVLAVLAGIGVLVGDRHPPRPAAEEASAIVTPIPVAPVRRSLSMASYLRLQNGMTYEQVAQIIGADGEELSRVELGGIDTVMYQWTAGFGSSMTAQFQNGRMVMKSQFGLR